MPDVFVKNATQNISPAPETIYENNVVSAVKDQNEPLVEAPSQTIKAPKINHVHLFSSYCENPGDISFQNQDEDEKVLLFIRRDFITNIPWIVASIILIILPFIAMYATQIFGNSISFLPQRFYLFFELFYYLLVVIYIYISFITWYFNISLITDRRIVDIDFEGLVYKNVSATKLDLVQDVSYTQVGVIRTFFDYGDVLVQTAGTIDNFVFDSAPSPERVVHVIEDLIGGGRRV